MQAATAVAKTYKLQPREKWVLIRKQIRGEEMRDGIIIPEARDERSQRGVVVALSSCAGRDRLGNEIPWDIAVGDLVVFTNYPMELPDLEELTGEKDLCLVQADEVFAAAKEA